MSLSSFMSQNDMVVFTDAIAEQYGRQFGNIIENFTEILLSGQTNSMNGLEFSRNLYIKYRMILPGGCEYGKFKMIHDGILICLFSSEKSVILDKYMHYEVGELLRCDDDWRSKTKIVPVVNWTNAIHYTIAIQDIVMNYSGHDQHKYAKIIKESMEVIFFKNMPSAELLYSPVELMASLANDLCFSVNGDADVVLQALSNQQQNSASDNFVTDIFQMAQNVLRVQGFRVLDMVNLDRAPVLKLEDIATHTHVDLCIQNTYSKRSRSLIKLFLEFDARARSLILVVKHWAIQRGVCNPENSTPSSYCWVIMTIFFLQQCQPPVLPVILMADADGDIVHKIQPLAIKNTDSQGELLLKFFLFFGESPPTDFNPFLQIISIRTKNIYSKRLNAQNLPSSNTIPLAKKLLPWWRFSVEDPIGRTHDLGSVISRYEGQVLIFTELHRAYLIMTDTKSLQGDEDNFDRLCEQNAMLPFLNTVCSKCDSIENNTDHYSTISIKCNLRRKEEKDATPDKAAKDDITTFALAATKDDATTSALVAEDDATIAGVVASSFEALSGVVAEDDATTPGIVAKDDATTPGTVAKDDATTPGIVASSFATIPGVVASSFATIPDNASKDDATTPAIAAEDDNEGEIDFAFSGSVTSSQITVRSKKRRHEYHSVKDHLGSVRISNSFYEQVLSWTAHDFMNPTLFSLRPLPAVFLSGADFFPRFPPFVLEETRAQLELVGNRRFDGVDRYKTTITCSNVIDGRVEDPMEELLDITILVYAGIDYEKVKKIGSSFALFVKDPPEVLTVEKLYDLRHVLVNMGYRQMTPDTSCNVGFSATIKNSSTAQDLILHPEQNWYLYLLSMVGSVAAERTWQALGRKEVPSFMSDIYFARYIPQGFPADPLALGDRTQSLPFTANLNESQRNVVKNVLDVGFYGVPQIQIVKGPPGTGKTSTLVALLMSLKASGRSVLATAPTNVAVNELSSRTLSAARRLLGAGGQAKDRLADILLIGTRERLKVEIEVDPLNDIFFDARIRRLEEAIEYFPRELSSFLSYFRRVLSEGDRDAADDDSGHRAEDEEATGRSATALKAITESLHCRLRSLYDEAPAGLVDNLTRSSMEAISTIFSSILSSEDTVLGRWLIDEGKTPAGQLPDRPIIVALKDILENIKLKKSNNLKREVFKQAQLVFSTVNVAGRDVFDSTSFDVVVIDEASQLVMAETCIVLRQRLKCLVLVGDDKQLPSTVTSQQCSALRYSESLFSRLLAAKYPFRLLDIQYRMHPDISRWPRGQFYDGLIVDGDNVMSDEYRKDWHKVLPPFALYDVESGEEETHVYGSKFNEAEAMVVRQIVRDIRGWQAGALTVTLTLTVGIISPYTEQVEVLKHLETKTDRLTLRVSTVDGFQGQECDIIIFSAVRSNDKREIGFLKDERRLNVAVTRAKYSLVVVGSVGTLSSDATWESLVNHAREQNCFYNSTNCPLIKKCSNKWNVSEQRIKDTLSPKSSVFESLPWKVVFNDELRNTLANSSTPLRAATVKAILRLCNGEWPKFELVNPLVPEKYKQVIHVHRVLLYRLVWSVDVCQVTHTQKLKLWNAVPPNLLPQAIQRVGSILDRYSSDYLARCATKLQNGSNYTPATWNSNAPFIWYRTSSQREGGQAVEGSAALERSHVNNSAALMKFYPLSSAVARLLVAMKSGQTIQLPFVMSEEEEGIVRHPGSAFILGRSGTGKTTAILHRMFLESAYSKMLTGSSSEKIPSGDAMVHRHRQLMVTASPILCAAIRRSYRDMCRAASLAEQGSPLDVCEECSEATVTSPNIDSLTNNTDSKLPTSLLNCDPDCFPLIMTYKDLLRLLDGTITRSFFALHPSSNTLDAVVKGEIIPPNQVAGEDTTLKEPSSGVEVDFDRFTSHYFPHFNEALTSEASVVYREIMSHIKGSLQALHSETGRLSRGEYRQLSQHRESSLSEKQRGEIYDAFVKYERLKGQQYRGDYDALDVVHHVYSALSVEGYRGVTVDSVYVDEVQDLTPAEITLFKFLSENPRGFVFAGDTAQTIAHGVGFRFETVKDIFYSEYLKGGDLKADIELMPKIWHLRQNYRTHVAVVNIANSIVDLILRFFPLSIDRLEPESSQVHGPLPIFVDGTDNLVVDLFQNNSPASSQSCQFGAEQVILVRDDVSKREVLEISGNRALVLTVLEAKGMEFTDCLVYNFFASSPCGNDWRVIYNAFESDEPCPTFDVQKHNLLCLELKLLYVLVTRAKQNLILYDQDFATRQPMLSLWKEKELVELKPLDDDIRSVFQTSSSSEEWVRIGAQLLERKQFSNARLCYQRAGDGQMEKLCRGYELEQEADHLAVRLPVESRRMYLRAVEEFALVAGQSLSVARCLEKAGEYTKAGEHYRNNNRHFEAGRCFEATDNWRDTAFSYYESGAIDQAVRGCYRAFDFDLALTFLDSARNSDLMDQEWIARSTRECTLKAAIHYHSNHNTTRMMEFVSRFATTTEKKGFLRRTNRLHQLLAAEVADSCFKEAAQVYEALFDFRKAAEFYRMALLPSEAVRCTLRAIRLRALDDHYLMTESLPNGDVELLQQLKDSIDLADQEDAKLEVELMLSSAQSSTELKIWKSLCLRTKSLLPYSWRLHYLATRYTLRTLFLLKETEDVAECCREMLTLLDLASPCMERLKGKGACQLLCPSDSELVMGCMECFEWTLEGRCSFSKTLIGPNNLSGLLPVFQVAKAPTASSSNSSSNSSLDIQTVKITIQEFSECVLKYFSVLRKRVIAESIVILTRAYQGVGSADIETQCNSIGPQTVPFKTSTKLQLIIDCHRVILISTNLIDLSRHVGHKKLRSELVNIVVNCRPRLDDIDEIVSARRNSEVISMLRMYREYDIGHVGLRYDLIIMSLNLAALTGDVPLVGWQLARGINIARRGLDPLDYISRYANFVHLRLIHSFQWEWADYRRTIENCPVFEGGSFVYSIKVGLLALQYEVDHGEIAQLLAGKTRDKLCNGCLSPLAFLQLVEKYLVLLLCHLKRFRDVLLPYGLARDVLCRRSKACREAILRFSDREDYQENNSVFFINEIMSLLYMLIRLLDRLTEANFDRWERMDSLPGSLSRSIAVGVTQSDFLMRAVSLFMIFLCNLRRSTAIWLQISLRMYDFKPFIWSKLPSYMKLCFDDFNEGIKCIRYTNFCFDVDHQTPLLLSVCDSPSLPEWCESPWYCYNLTKAILVAGEGEEVMIIPPTKRTSSTAHQKGKEKEIVYNTKKEVLEEKEEEEVEVDEDQLETASVTSLLSVAPTLLPNLIAEKKEAITVRRYYPRLKAQLLRARARLQGLSPLTRLLRVVEKEFLGIGWPRVAVEVRQYTSSLCPYRLRLQEWYDAVETFIQVAETDAKPTKLSDDVELLFHAKSIKERLQKLLSDLKPSRLLVEKRDVLLSSLSTCTTSLAYDNSEINSINYSSSTTLTTENDTHSILPTTGDRSKDWFFHYQDALNDVLCHNEYIQGNSSTKLAKSNTEKIANLKNKWRKDKSGHQPRIESEAKEDTSSPPCKLLPIITTNTISSISPALKIQTDGAMSPFTRHIATLEDMAEKAIRGLQEDGIIKLLFSSNSAILNISDSSGNNDDSRYRSSRSGSISSSTRKLSISYNNASCSLNEKSATSSPPKTNERRPCSSENSASKIKAT